VTVAATAASTKAITLAYTHANNKPIQLEGNNSFNLLRENDGFLVPKITLTFIYDVTSVQKYSQHV